MNSGALWAKSIGSQSQTRLSGIFSPQLTPMTAPRAGWMALLASRATKLLSENPNEQLWIRLLATPWTVAHQAPLSMVNF